MGTDRAKAFAAARKLDALLVQSYDLVARVAGASETVADAIAVFRKDDVPQVLPEQLTREFAKVRYAAAIVSENPPTFHEVRSLGGALLQGAGWSLKQVQALMGHASEEMTKVYLEGHESPWQTITQVFQSQWGHSASTSAALCVAAIETPLG